MSNIVVKSPMQYLDKATGTLRDLGLMPAAVPDAPINALLQKISDLDQDRIAIIARTLRYEGATATSLLTGSRPSFRHGRNPNRHDAAQQAR